MIFKPIRRKPQPGRTAKTSCQKPIRPSNLERSIKPDSELADPADALHPSNVVRKMLSPQQKSKELMTRDATNQLVTYRMKGFRPEAWEEDISRNTLDREPFENLPAPSEREFSEFKIPPRFKSIETLLDGRSLKEMIDRDTFPIPCPDDREGYSPGRDELYWLNGLQDYLRVMEVAERYDVRLQSILDFGSASGRVIRHFAAQTEIPEIWASDINWRHIRWLFEFMPPQVKPVFNHCIPSLPIRDNSINVITAFSVFTHMNTFETCWLAELRRIMRDDGICYLTVHNEDTWNICRQELGNPDNRLVQSILKIDPDVINKIHEPLEDTRTVYRFAQSGPYRARYFIQTVTFTKSGAGSLRSKKSSRAHHVRQTVVVLRKK